MIRTTVSALALTLVAAPMAVSAQEGAQSATVAYAVEMAEGTVQSVDLENDSFTLKVGERTLDVKIGEGTAYILDGQASTREQVLKRGATVTVTHEGGRASKVEGKSA